MKKLLTFLALSSSFLTLNAQIINTIGGKGINGYSGDGGPATAAEMSDVMGVAVNSMGEVYAGTQDYRVRKIGTNGIITTFAGKGQVGYSGDGGPATAAKIAELFGVTVDAQDNLYIGDYGNSCIRMVNTNGIITTYAGNGINGYSGDGGPATAAELAFVSGLAANIQGNLYIADAGNNRIRMVNSAGIITTVAGINNPGFSGDGGPATVAKIDDPQGVFVDNSGNIYICDGSYRLRWVNTNGIITTIAGNGTSANTGDGGPATAAEVDYPCGGAVDASGNLYVVSGAKIRMINTSGIISTYAGTGSFGFSGDGGPATAAKIGTWNINFDASYNMYLAEANYYRVREISTPLLVGNINPKEEKITLYPNPNSGRFTIESSVVSGNSSVIEIYNVLGEKVYSQPFSIQNSEFNINIGTQPRGIYLYRILTEAGNLVSTGKFIIQK